MSICSHTNKALNICLSFPSSTISCYFLFMLPYIHFLPSPTRIPTNDVFLIIACSYFVFFIPDTCVSLHQRDHPSMRRVVVQEIVTTEHEYIHDLEALMQVIQLAPSRPHGSQGVHLPSLMGNLTEVRCCLSLYLVQFLDLF